MERRKPFLRSVVEDGRQTVVARLLIESAGPIRSIVSYYANRLSGGRLKPDLTKYFGPSEKKDYQPTINLEETHGILSNIDERIIGTNRVPENFIGEEYQEWIALKSRVDSLLGSRATLTDYVLFDRVNNSHYLFLTGNKRLISIKVDPQGFNEQNLEKQIANNPTMLISDGQKEGELDTTINTESTIASLMQTSFVDSESAILRRMSSVTNDFACQRHVVFEKEGQLFTELRHLGVWSLGEYQDLNRVLFSQGVFFDNQTQQVMIDQDLARELVRLRKLTLGADTGQTLDQTKAEIRSYANERIYYEMIMQYFKENPRIVNEFLQTETYAKIYMQFKDRYLSSIGLTEQAVAANMLANYYLLKLEGVTAKDSPSQVFLAKIPQFHDQLQRFVESHIEVAPPLPQGLVGETISELFNHLQKRDYGFTKLRLNETTKNAVLNKARNRFAAIRSQIKHYQVNKAILSALDKTPIIPSKRGVMTTAIGNVGLARIPGERQFTVSSWLTHADDYLEDGKPLPEFYPSDDVATQEQMDEVIKEVFNTELSDGQTAYASQEKRILEAAPVIVSYLQHGDRVPANVRTFMQTLSTPEFTVKILEKFGSMADNDPLIVNRFFPDGFAEFQKSAIYRYVFEFVRGVETNMILVKPGNHTQKFSRRFIGQWQNNNFSNENQDTIDLAISRTLKDASHRIDILNHEQGVSKRSLKDWQEFFEKVFGWDTFDMKHLRWENFWDIWNTLGGAWDCICFSRKSIFNPRVFQQW